MGHSEITICERLRRLYRTAVQGGNEQAMSELEEIYFGVKSLNRKLNVHAHGEEAVQANKWFSETFWREQLQKIRGESPPRGHQPLLQRRHVIEPAATVDIDPSVGWGRDVKIDTTGGVLIGPHTNITHRVTIITHLHSGLTAAPDEAEPFGKLVPCPLTIGRCVFIGESAVILPQVGRIGDWAVIGAFSVVTKPVGAGEIWAGNPARFIRMRPGMGRQHAALLEDC